MDHLAAKGLKLQPRKRDIYSHTVAGLYDNKGKLATDLSSFLYQHINGGKTKEYIASKFDWEEETIRNIDWEALGEIMKKYPQYQKNKMIQIMYDWQNVGFQKELLQQSDGRCPGCPEKETHLHYLVCENKTMKQARKDATAVL